MAPGGDWQKQSMGPFFLGDREPILKSSFICGSGSCADNPDVNSLGASVSGSGSTPAGRARCAVLRPALTALLWAALALPGARASDKLDHERARAAVQAGQALPLPKLLERLQRTHPGRVLELELEREDGRWIYEVKLLQTNGQLLKLELDAGTGQVLQVKRREDGRNRHTEERKLEPSKEPAK